MARQTLCEVCGNNTAFNHAIMAGQYYWIRHVTDDLVEAWEPCYVCEDSDENLWVYFIDRPNLKVSDMGEKNWEFRELRPPEKGREGTYGKHPVNR